MNVAIDQETRDALEEIASARIFFGHKSVGNDLVEGLSNLAQEAGIQIRFVELESEQIPLDTPVFVHARPGRNQYPREKMDGFFAALPQQGDAWKPDLAMMKLCFVDVAPDTDTDELASYYKKKVQEAQPALGNTVLMHVTTPLKERPDDLKSHFKRLIGKMVWEDEANKKRQILNEEIASAFHDAPVFDLALAEATAPDGRRSANGEDDNADYSLRSEYTDDGGHLNELGQTTVGKAFAVALASALRARRSSERPVMEAGQ